MTPIICMFIFLYGLLEKTIAWTMAATALTFVVAFSIEFFYTWYLFNGMLEAMARISEAIK